MGFGMFAKYGRKKTRLEQKIEQGWRYPSSLDEGDYVQDDVLSIKYAVYYYSFKKTKKGFYVYRHKKDGVLVVGHFKNAKDSAKAVVYHYNGLNKAPIAGWGEEYKGD